MRYAAAILVGRCVRLAARIRKPGGGSAIPGLIVNRLAPRFLPRTLNSFPEGLVIVSGSAGKSTTTKMLVAVLRAHGKRVFTNPSTANIAQGLTSALLEKASLAGTVEADVAVLEMDEGHGAALAPRLTPSTVVLTNVMVDQIDRFHDSHMVGRMLATIAGQASRHLIVNADDGFVAGLTGATADVDISRFGVSGTVLAGTARGLGYSETTASRLDDGAGTRVESVAGTEAVIQHGHEQVTVTLPARGVHYAVDAAAALSAAAAVLGEEFDLTLSADTISGIPPVFGRGEVREIRGELVEFVLVQNPASYQLNVDSLDPETEQILVAVGSDVRDPSYLWPVDTSRLGRVAVVTGSKAWEAALQLVYDGVTVDRIEPDLATGLDAFLALPKPAVGMKTIVFTADSMRRSRAHLGLTTNRETVS